VVVAGAGLVSVVSYSSSTVVVGAGLVSVVSYSSSTVAGVSTGTGVSSTGALVSPTQQ